MQLENINKDGFARLLQGNFLVTDEPANQFVIQLVEVTDGAKAPQQEIFSLLFHGPQKPFMPQGIHKLMHNQLGEIEIFLVPVGEDTDGFQYQAVFNRMVSLK